MADASTTTAASTQTHNRKTALTDDIRTHFAGNAPLQEKVAGFAKARPWASAAFAGVAALGVLNVLRGKR